MTAAEAIKVLEKLREGAFTRQRDYRGDSLWGGGAGYLAEQREAEEALTLAIQALQTNGGSR